MTDETRVRFTEKSVFHRFFRILIVYKIKFNIRINTMKSFCRFQNRTFVSFQSKRTVCGKKKSVISRFHSYLRSTLHAIVFQKKKKKSSTILFNNVMFVRRTYFAILPSNYKTLQHYKTPCVVEIVRLIGVSYKHQILCMVGPQSKKRILSKNN